MPSNVDLFNMLRRSTLEGLTDELLLNEMNRVDRMQHAVDEYRQLVAEVATARIPPETDIEQ